MSTRLEIARTKGRTAAVSALLAIVLPLVFAGSASAITPTVSEFSAGLTAFSVPLGITTGPDGKLWFTDPALSPHEAVGVFDPGSQASSEFGQANGLQANSAPKWIATGSDGNVWFTDSGCGGTGACEIGRVNPSSHAISEFSTGLNLNAFPEGIAAGPDGNLWFTDRGTTPAIGRINPGTHAIAEFSAGLNPGSSPVGISAGPDGNLWFADGGSTRAIGRINPGTHAINEFSAGLNAGSIPSQITAGPDGRVWFTDRGTISAIGAIDPATHAITEFSAGLNPGSQPNGIAAGPDGDLWFTDNGSTMAIGRIDPGTGAISEFSAGLNQSPSGPVGITAGADGNMWFVERGSPAAIGRITTPPTAETASAAATGPKSATVNGSANGHAQPTSFRIEYGPFGKAKTSTAEKSLGTTSGQTPFSATLTGLTPATTYEARVVATNPTDSTAGAFVSFTTAKDAPNTKITKAKISSAKHKALFKFKAIGTATGFQCSLKRKHAHQKASFKKCRSPKAYKHLNRGKYTFKVRAVGPGGRDPAPAKRKFRIA